MTKVRKEVRNQIIEILKREMNRTEALENYSQWIMGVSISENKPADTQETSYTARIIIKTNQSPYLDGMDIVFTESKDSKKANRVEIDPYYCENTPEFQGGEVKDAIEWIERNGYIVYLQEQDPYREFLYIERLKDIIGEYAFRTLDEYHFDRSNGRSSILEVYKDLLQETLLEQVSVEGKEVSPGVYRLSIVSNNRSYILNPRSSFTKDEVIGEIQEVIIKDIVADKVDDEDDNFEKYRRIKNKTSSI